MTLQRQLAYWAVGLLVFLLVIYVLRGVLLPFVAAMALAYLLDPVADRLERLGLSRFWATVVMVVAALIALALILAIVLPLIGEQLVRLAAVLPGAIQQFETFLREDPWVRRMVGALPNMEGQLSGFAKDVVGWAAAVIKSLWSGGLALFSLISLLVVTPVVTFYLLVDWDRMIAEVDSWLPRDHAETIRALIGDIDSAMAGFVRGQVSVAAILGIFYALALSLIGLDFGLLIGLTAGVVSIVPYVGSIVGLIASVGMAVAQTWSGTDWVFVGGVAAIFLFGQFVEGNFLSPRLIGGNIGLHPVWLMLALFAFGYLFGFVGLLIAVPAAAAIGVVARFMLRQYLASQLYRGGPGDEEPGA